MLTMITANSGSKKLELLLARIAAKKDQAAFAELYYATKGKLFSTVLRIVTRWDCAEEIVQDAYVRIWHHANSYRSSSGSPMTWMITIARNLSIDHVRKPGRETHFNDSMLLELPADGPTALETIEISEGQQTAMQQHRDVVCALQSLHPTRRDLLIAAYIHGQSREQLSKRTGVPVNTVKTWIRRALLDVEKTLRGMGESPPVLGKVPEVFETNRLQIASQALCSNAITLGRTKSRYANLTEDWAEVSAKTVSISPDSKCVISAEMLMRETA